MSVLHRHPWAKSLIHSSWCLLDRAPLMKYYLDSKDAGTIPSHLAKYKAKYFKYGSADNGGRLGSKLYELNTFAWQFGRTMARLSPFYQVIVPYCTYCLFHCYQYCLYCSVLFFGIVGIVFKTNNIVVVLLQILCSIVWVLFCGNQYCLKCSTILFSKQYCFLLFTILFGIVYNINCIFLNIVHHYNIVQNINNIVFNF